MRVTTKGQETIPINIRESLGITHETEVEFIEENGRFYLAKVNSRKATKKFAKLRRIATVKMSTDEIYDLTRER
ncbi:MAG: AbrB/MazE/SpoVT family DNA-binding domain-containing protein [Cyanobacteria bacterium P01_G01_bin.67]